MTQAGPLILVVEDDRTTLMFIEECLDAQHYQIITTDNVKDAIEIIKKESENISAMILDRMLPDRDGIEIAKWMNNHKSLPKIPIIMQTSSEHPDQVKEGVDAGVFYYLTKPVKKQILQSVVLSAMRETKQRKLLDLEINKHRNSFKLIHSARFKAQTLDEVNQLALFVCNCFPNPQRILAAIVELLVNAVEHGNCGISYDEKTKLISENRWHDEVIKRCALEKNKDKFVNITFTKTAEAASIAIIDEGEGFNWANYIKLDQSRALDLHGRGIARANMLFDSLEYKDKGNKVIGTVLNSNENSLKW